MSIIFKPRAYQQPFLDFMANGGDRAFLVWHRRAGKNMCAWQWLYSEALLNVGVYYYVFPSKTAGKKILWEGKTGEETENTKFMDLIDPDFIWPNPRDGVNNTDMTIKLRHPLDYTKEGSMIQIVGTKSEGGKSEADHLRGTNPRGVIMDEFSEHNPAVWETIISPILMENKGWALFTLTPKGPNAAFRMYNNIKDNPRWFVQVLDITQTKRENGLPVIDEAFIEEERAEGKDEAYIQQEYYVSWAGVAKGAYYRDQLDLMYKENRFTPGLRKSELDCFTTWDIGHEDATVVLVGQCIGPYTSFIDGFKVNHKDLQWCWTMLQEMALARGYRYAVHYFPWDFVVHEWGASQTREQAALQLGMRNIRTAPKLSKEVGRNLVRKDFPNWRFDSEKLGWVISDLGEHSADEASKAPHIHTADAIRTYATSNRMLSREMIAELPQYADGMVDIFQERHDERQYGRIRDYRTGYVGQRPNAGRLYPRTTLGSSAWSSQY